MKRIILLVILFDFIIRAQPFVKKADVSFIPQLEDSGAVFYQKGIPEDPLEIFKNNEINYIRLRLWHSPSSG
jgi:arabinogalactan endo-1,4-beta-galactosidase